ncbi:hypothetical protein [Saccharopolyspora hattusasensis]|uniref:hypothetical protein n=1 Tax=Saccharopolyspora hattusasensis TaxID=1128679 RepID=UPI003D989F64
MPETIGLRSTPPRPALRAVTVLLAFVLALAIASALMDALSTPRLSAAASTPKDHHTLPRVRYLVLIQPIAAPTVLESQP